MIENRPGWEWKNGYWSKVTGPSHKHKLSLFCPHCKIPTGTIDDKFLLTIGICSQCYVKHCESRKTPDIDLRKYTKVKFIETINVSNREFLKHFKEK